MATTTAELGLLAASVAGRSEVARRAAMAVAVREASLDWDRVLAAVRRHRMAGFLHRALAEVGVTPPEPVAGALRDLAVADARAALKGATEAVRLVRLMQARDIPVMVLKGPVVAALLHGDLCVRQTRDLDLLVPREKVAEAMKVCGRAGYQPVAPAPEVDDPSLSLWFDNEKDIKMWSGGVGVLLELHIRPVPNHWQARRLDLWTGVGAVQLGPEANVPAPGRDSLYAYLCTHGALHGWSRLKWLADVTTMTDGASDEEVLRLHQAASDRGAARASGLALLLIGRLWGRALPADLTKALEADGRLGRLERLAWKVLTDPREPGDARELSREIMLSLLMLEDGWPHRLAEVRQWLFHWETVRTLRLPRPLWGLYQVLKFPVWVGRKVAGTRQARAGLRAKS